MFDESRNFVISLKMLLSSDVDSTRRVLVVVSASVGLGRALHGSESPAAVMPLVRLPDSRSDQATFRNSSPQPTNRRRCE